MRLSNPTRTKLTSAILAAADVAATAGQEVEFARWKGIIGMALALGYGPYDKLNEAVGRALIDLKAVGGVDFDGLIRIEIHDAQDNFLMKVFEDRTESLRVATPYSEMTPFPVLKDKSVGRDSYFVFKVVSDAAASIDVSASKVLLDCTQYQVQYNY